MNDTSSKMILPILPLFIQQLGGTGIAVGVIAGLGDSVSSLFKLLAGYWSDRAGKRKRFVFWGYLTSAAAKSLFAFANSWPHILILRLAERLGKGIRSAPRDALLAASTVRQQRGRGFGIHRAMDSGGAVLGTLFAFGLFWFLGLGFTHIFLIAGVIGFASMLPLALVHEVDRTHDRRNYRLSFRSLPPELRVFIGVACLFALGNFSYMFFILRSESAFVGKIAVGIPILLYALYNFAYTVFAVPSGVLSDRIGRRRVLILGYGLFGLVSLGFVFFTSVGALVVLFVLFGLNYALVEANERAFVSDLAPEEHRGAALGSYHMATSVAALPAGLVAGALWDVDPRYTFVYGAVLSVTAVVLLMITSNPRHQATPQQAAEH